MVVMASCQQTKKVFGITVQKKENDYEFVWAFKISLDSAKREGFEHNKVHGNIFNAVEYPGCPYCGAQTWFQCGRCKRIVCMNSEQTVVTCPECGNKGELVTVDRFELNGGMM